MRQDWVDIAKGLSIMAIVIWHIEVSWTDTPLMPAHVLLSGIWPVPLFFLLAGFFINNEKMLDTKNFMLRRVKRLYLPTVCLYLGAVLLHNVFIETGFYDVNMDYGKYITPYSLTDTLKQLFLSIFLAGQELIVAPLWFACVLFVSLCLMAIVTKIIVRFTYDEQRIRNIQLMLFFLPAFLYGIAKYIGQFHIPRYDQLLSAVWLIYVGMIIRGKSINLKFNSGTLAIISLFIVYGFTVIQTDNNNIASYTLCTLAACYFICYISKIIEQKLGFLRKILSKIGRESFYIMGLHLLGFKCCTIILNALGCNLNLAKLIAPAGDSLPLFLCYLLFGTFIPVLMIDTFRWVRLRS